MEDYQLSKENITLIDPNRVGGSTALLVGGSLSGKTTLLMQALTNILGDYPDRYDVILVFSESLNSEPLQAFLNEGSYKVHFFPVFMKELVTLAVQMNKATDNRYGFLMILDDAIDGLRGKITSKMINIYRNSNISTIISCQYVKMIGPAARSSFHNVFITGARNQEIIKTIIDTFIKGHLMDMGYKNKDSMIKMVREMTKMGEDERSLILLQQIEDKMSVHKILK